MGSRVDIREVAGLVLDLPALLGRVDRVLGQELHWFPVRHHSPTVAHHLGATIRARKPALVLIEGPCEANHLLPHLLDRKTRPPVAIYSSYRDDDNVLGRAGIDTPAVDIPARFAAWYPVLPYSPELVAMAAAREVGADCAFIDLPHHALIEPGQSLGRPPGNAEPPPSSDELTTATPSAAPPTATLPAQEAGGAEHLIVRSEFYQRLAAAAGFRTFNEAWDSLFEVGGVRRDREDFRRDLAYFCAAARATTDPQQIADDDTLPRERFMIREIRRQITQRGLGEQDVVVVTGGFHMLLDRDDPTEPPRPPPGTLHTTVVPYSYYRVAEISGYAAGNRAPAFYQLQWDAISKARDHDDLVIEHVTRVLRRGRRKGDVLSSADAIAVTQHAMMLGRLRGRSEPTLDDIEDALLTCCCKGDPQQVGLDLLAAMRDAAVGSRVGKVTDALGQLPIVADFYAQVSDLSLGSILDKDLDQRLTLDRKDPEHARRSAFLHRLVFLGVGACALETAGNGLDGTIFQEDWRLRWSPRVEPTLIERSQYGDTIQSAAIAKLEESLAHDRLSAGATTRRIVEALDMDLPGFAHRIDVICGPTIDDDARFVSLAEALTHLLVLDKRASYQGLRRDVTGELVGRCFSRASFAIPNIASVPPQEEADVIAGLVAIADAVISETKLGLDRDLFAEYIKIAAADTTVMTMRGVFLGLLAEIRIIEAGDLAAEITGLARGSVETMLGAGDFVRGVMEVSRTSLMLGADAIIEAVDELLRAADWETFLTMLPRLREAFTRLQGADLGTMCDRVALRYGLREAEELDLDLTVGAAALMATIDHRVAEIMDGWEL
ncbi:MAG: DUF5682 family protein [Myxococcota bacterium]